MPTELAIYNSWGAEHWVPPKPRGSCLVIHDDTAVSVTGEPLNEIWWRGRKWAVTSYGIERLDGCYHIEKSELGMSLPGHSWAEQISSKGRGWDRDDFITAWLIAVALHGCSRATPERLREAISRSWVEKS